MKIIKLSQSQFTLVDDEDFDYLNQWKWCAMKNYYTFYAMRAFKHNSKFYAILMHRAIMEQENPKIYVDHIDQNGLHNFRSNLRLANSSQNSANRRAKKNGTSDYLGVSWDRSANIWNVRITKNQQKINLGAFKNEQDAAIAYDKAAIELHGEFANLNFKAPIA